jgi:hypothetical protein
VGYILQASQEEAAYTLLYNLCLLIITKKEAFEVIGMQTDNTLFLASDEFAALEDSKLQKA